MPCGVVISLAVTKPLRSRSNQVGAVGFELTTSWSQTRNRQLLTIMSELVLTVENH